LKRARVDGAEPAELARQGPGRRQMARRNGDGPCSAVDTAAGGSGRIISRGFFGGDGGEGLLVILMWQPGALCSAEPSVALVLTASAARDAVGDRGKLDWD